MDSEYTYETENDSQLNGSREDSDVDDMHADPILKAAQRGDIDEVLECLKSKPEAPHVSDDDGYTALHRACEHGKAEVAKLLIVRKLVVMI